MRAVVLRSLAVLAIGAVVLVGVLYVASTVDSRPPAVIGFSLTQPVGDDEMRALITTSLEVSFTEPVDPDGAVEALSLEPRVPGAVSWSGSTMIFTPSDPLALATSYTATVGPGVEDLAGNRMAELPEPFTFETTGPPEVVETSPVDGATDVVVDGPIVVTFSTLMDTASVESALDLRPAFAHEPRWSGQILEIVPSEPLRPDTEYRIRIGEHAFDVAGVALAEPVQLRFRTVEPGLEPTAMMPASGTDGAAPTTPIAVFFDRPVDPGSVSADLLRITPSVAGSLALVDSRGDPPADDSEGRILRFVPSGPLPANTTFEVVLEAGITGLDGDGLAQPITWTFTTGAPQATLSNQVVFLSDRAGIANLWAMNPDGSAPRQVSAELTPILDYAVTPDGSSLVVSDGRSLVLMAADGGDRRALTEDGLVEFDPAFSPNGQRLAFARADATTGAGLGIWQRPVRGDAATPIERPDDADSPAPAPTTEGAEPPDWRRSPRYAPEGDAVAWVDPRGSVAILDLAEGELTEAPFFASGPPLWLPDGSGILLTGRERGGAAPEPVIGAAIAPLDPETGPITTVVALHVGATAVDPSPFGPGTALAAVASDGRVAYLVDDGGLRLTDSLDRAGRAPTGLSDDRVSAVAFAPGEEALVAVVLGPSVHDPTEGRIERLELVGGRRNVLANDGWRPRWLP